MTNEELVKEIQKGKTMYISDLWYQTEKFILMYANKFYIRYGDNIDKNVVSVEDLYQSGYFALLKATDKYTEIEGALFIHYLSYYLLNEFQTTSGLRSKYKQTQFDKSVLSADIPINEDSDDEILLIDTVKDARDYYETIEDKVFYESIHKKIDEFLDDALNPIHANIIKDSFWNHKSLEEIAEKYGKSKKYIASTKTTALSFLKHSYQNFKSGRQLKEMLPINYYGGTGIKAFLHSGCSIEEKLILMRERLGLTGT